MAGSLPASTVNLIDAGTQLVEGLKSFIDTGTAPNGSLAQAAGIISLAGIATNVAQNLVNDPSAKALFRLGGGTFALTGFAIAAGEATAAAEAFVIARAGTDQEAYDVALTNLYDKTFGLVAATGGVIAMVPAPGAQLRTPRVRDDFFFTCQAHAVMSPPSDMTRCA